MHSFHKHTVPTLVMQIERDQTGLPPLTGFGIGDGCMGLGNMGACGVNDAALFYEFMYGHSFMSSREYNHLLNECGNGMVYGNETKQCQTAMDEARANLGGFNIYAVYDECYLENDQVYDLKHGQNGRFDLKHGFDGAQFRDNGDDGNDEYKCGGWTVTDIYLNQPEVKRAVHIPNEVEWQWQVM